MSGLPTPGPIDPSTRLLVLDSKIAPTDRALILSADDPELALGIARLVAEVHVLSNSYTASKQLHQLIEARGVTNLTVHGDILESLSMLRFNVAFLAIPKGRDLARDQMWYARRVLLPGGKLYIAGPTVGGAKSIIKDAEKMLGRCVTLEARNRHRLAVAVLPDNLPDYPIDWIEYSWLVIHQREFNTPLGSVVLATRAGIFSWQAVDDGTAFLLENIPFESGQRILDMGCGNGIIGVLAARTAAYVLMVDDNLLAVSCAKRSIEINGLTNAEAKASDVYDNVELQHFDLIVSNPPFHKEFDVNTNVAHRIIRGAKKYLHNGGRLVLVANAFLNYEQVMAEQAETVQVLAHDNRYKVIEGCF